MKRILVVGEDGLCCALGERLVAATLAGWTLAGPPVDKQGITKLVPRLPALIQQAEYVQPVLCVVDTDRRCPVDLLKDWLPKQPMPKQFLFRLAVTEAESWVLADRQRFAQFFGVPMNRIPMSTDDVDDPKQLVLTLVRRSRYRLYQEEMVSKSHPSKPGTGYNAHLKQFIKEAWRPREGRLASASLARALQRMDVFSGCA
jgi:hypothetical protein